MTTTLRKCISFGPDGTINPSPGEQQSVTYYDPGSASYPNLNIIVDSGTRWVKIWVDLFTLWPTAPGTLNPGPINTVLRDILDYQIALARVYGCGVVLTINHRLPNWITGVNTPNPTQVFRMPQDPSINGPFAAALASLMSRYSLGNPNRPYAPYGYVDVVEFCNEPNGTWTITPGEDLVGTVAELFKTARQISSALNGSPLAGGPATSDTVSWQDPFNYYNFTALLLSELNSNGFYDIGSNGLCVWTQHNYADVTFDHGPNTNSPDRTTYRTGDPRFNRYNLRSKTTAEALQAFGWKGWPVGQVEHPRLLLTEGGAKRDSVVSHWGLADPNPATEKAAFEFIQMVLMYRALERMGSNTDGFGVEMLTQYLTFSNPTFDSGMWDQNTLSPPRSIYPNAWKPFPGRL